MSKRNWERPDIQPRYRTRLRDIRTEPQTKSLNSNYDSTVCCACHWPIAKNSVMLMSVNQGVREYRHSRCPSLSERRAARLESVNA